MSTSMPATSVFATGAGKWWALHNTMNATLAGHHPDRAPRGAQQLPPCGSTPMTEQRARTAGKDSSHVTALGIESGVPHCVHAPVYPVKPADPHAPIDRAPPEAQCG